MARYNSYQVQFTHSKVHFIHDSKITFTLGVSVWPLPNYWFMGLTFQVLCSIPLPSIGPCFSQSITTGYCLHIAPSFILSGLLLTDLVHTGHLPIWVPFSVIYLFSLSSCSWFSRQAYRSGFAIPFSNRTTFLSRPVHHEPTPSWGGHTAWLVSLHWTRLWSVWSVG